MEVIMNMCSVMERNSDISELIVLEKGKFDR
jgi:hypothetical protein